jgi:hypothetical protein
MAIENKNVQADSDTLSGNEHEVVEIDSERLTIEVPTNIKAGLFSTVWTCETAN